MLEREIEGPVCKWAKNHGFLVVKVKFLDIGYPDRLFISPRGHTIFIEFKRPGKKPEVIQQYRLTQLRKRNIPAYWCDTYVEAVRLLQTALEPEELPETSNPPAVVTSIRRAIAGSRTGQDVDGPSYDKDTEEQRADQSRINRSPPPPDDGDVA